MKKLLIILMVISILFLSSCSNISNDDTSNDTTSEALYTNIEPEIRNVSMETIEALVKPGLTYGLALAVLGTPRTDESSTNYPIIRSWNIADGKILQIIFDFENRQEFLECYNRGDFVLSEETKHTEEGYPIPTDNEKKVYTEWLRSYKAVVAYIEYGDEKDVLFEEEISLT